MYLIRVTEQNALYCGITTDVDRRLEQHKSAKGAKWFRGKSNLRLVWQQTCADRAEASRLEAQIKALSKQQKEALVRQ
ncbi:MAG: GIY-YIG nuclease family protein [Aestuariibacter sp.]